MAYRAIIKNGKPMGMSYKTSDAIKYQKKFIKYVQEEAIKQKWEKSLDKSQHYYMDVIFYFPRVDMDANNYFKILADSITEAGNVWIDDTQLCERVQKILYSPEDPHVDIEIYPVDYIGIFDNISQFNDFKENCIGCKRFKRNCSILAKACEGKIQVEIKNNICEKFNEIKEGIQWEIK